MVATTWPRGLTTEDVRRHVRRRKACTGQGCRAECSSLGTDRLQIDQTGQIDDVYPMLPLWNVVQDSTDPTQDVCLGSCR